MAKKVKTDLFAGIMNAPEKKSTTTVKTALAKKPAASGSSKKAPVQAEKKIVQTVEEVNPPTVSMTPTLDQLLKKIEKPSASSHTFYLKDSVFEKLTEAAKQKGTSPSKLLEALIEITL